MTLESHYKTQHPAYLRNAISTSKYNNSLKTSNPWEYGEDSYFLYSLLDLLRSRRGLGVTDPRHMFYAHFGILHRRVDLAIDYQLTTSETSETFARERISRKGYGILSYIEDIELDQRRQGLTSWVPDWTSHPRAVVAIVDILTESDYEARSM